MQRRQCLTNDISLRLIFILSISITLFIYNCIIYVYLPTYPNLSIFIYLYIIAADPGAGIGLVIIVFPKLSTTLTLFESRLYPGKKSLSCSPDFALIAVAVKVRVLQVVLLVPASSNRKNLNYRLHLI